MSQARLSDLYEERYRPVRFKPAQQTLQSLHTPPSTRASSVNETSGEDARKFYEELINEPSTSSRSEIIIDSSSSSKSESDSRTRTRHGATRHRKDVTTVNCDDRRLINRLLTSSQNNDLKDVKCCLDKGVAIDCKDEYGWTPLMCASQTGANQVVRYLLEKGSDCKVKDTSGRTAAGIALIANQIKTYELIENGVKSKPKVKQEPEDVYFCEICQRNVSGRRDKHEASLAHQLNESGRRESRTMYQLPEHNRGFQMMLRSGWSQESGLGSRGQGQKYPVKTVLRKTRACLGNEQTSKPRVTHTQDEIHQKPKRVASKPKKIKGKEWEKAMRSYLDL